MGAHEYKQQVRYNNNLPYNQKAECTTKIRAAFADTFGFGCVFDSWYDEYLSTDNVHPTDLGAKVIAMQMLVDAPEIMQYGGD